MGDFTDKRQKGHPQQKVGKSQECSGIWVAFRFVD